LDFTVSSSAEIGLVGQETEVTAKARRRQFTAEYKLKVLAEAEACTKPGEIGALLRREGLYSSHLVEWRRARDSGALAGLAPRKRGPAAKVPHPLERKVADLEREVARATRCRFPRSFTARSSRHLTAPDVTVSRCGHCGGRS